MRGRVENVKKRGKKYENEERTFFFFFFFFFCLSLFETTEICFGCAKMEIFYQEKANVMLGKTTGKMSLPPPPPKNIPLTPLITTLLHSYHDLVSCLYSSSRVHEKVISSVFDCR